MKTLNYKRNNNIYNTHYYIKKTDMGLGANASRPNMKVDAVESTPNAWLGADASRSNMWMDSVASRPNVRLGVDASKANLELGGNASSPTWDWAWTCPSPTCFYHQRKTI